MSVDELALRLAQPAPVRLPEGWASRPEVEAAQRRLAEKAIAKWP